MPERSSPWHWLQAGAQTIQNLAIVRNAAKQVSSPSSSTTTAQQVWIRALPGHTRAVQCLAFHPQGSMLASCSSDNTIRLWDLNAWGESRRFTPQHRMHFGGLRNIAFDPSGKYLAGLMTYGASIYIWNVETGKPVKKLVGHTGVGYGIAYHPFRALLASCAGDGTVRVWNPMRRQANFILSGHAAKQRENADGTVSEEPASVYDVAFEPRRNVLASCADDMTIQLWNPEDGQHLGTLTGHSDKVYALAFHPTADLLATASKDRTIRLWDFNTGSQGLILSGHSESVMSVAFNHDGQLLASCDVSIRKSGDGGLSPPRARVRRHAGVRCVICGW